MIQGRVNEDCEPVILLPVHGLAGPIEVVVDTGFSGSRCLSRRHLERLAPDVVGAEVYELGDGSRIELEVSLIRITWMNREIEVEVVPAESHGSPHRDRPAEISRASNRLQEATPDDRVESSPEARFIMDATRR